MHLMHTKVTKIYQNFLWTQQFFTEHPLNFYKACKIFEVHVYLKRFSQQVTFLRGNFRNGCHGNVLLGL